MISLVLAASLALAADEEGNPFDNGRAQCGASDAQPIAGSAGFYNALSALRTNASTYSASAYAERHALRKLTAMEDGKVVGYGEANLNLGVTKVAVYQTDARGGDGCPIEYMLGTRAVDMYAYNYAIAGRFGRFGAFYSASITMGYPAELAYLRGYQTFGTVMMAPFMTLTLPLVGSWQTQTGASAYAQDFVFGAVADLELGDVRAGYTQSRGWYLSAQDKYVGLFGSVVLRDGFQFVGQFRGGVERAPVGKADEKVGRPSAFARLLPLTDILEDPAGGLRQVNLFTGHLEQEGIGGVLDVRGAYAVRPVAQLHEASIAVHDDEWYAIDDAKVPTRATHLYAEAGFVTLPAQYYYGLEGGTVLQARFEYQRSIVVDGVPLGSFVGTAMFNDPEQTALYPFAVNNLAIRAQVKVGM